MYNSTTVKQLIDWIRNEVETRGGVRCGAKGTPMQGSYSMSVCSDGTIGCLIGQGLKAIGATEPRPLAGIASLCGGDVDDGNKRWLSRVQYGNDMSHLWGDSVAYADRMQMEYLARLLTGCGDLDRLTEA